MTKTYYLFKNVKFIYSIDKYGYKAISFGVFYYPANEYVHVNNLEIELNLFKLNMKLRFGEEM